MRAALLSPRHPSRTLILSSAVARPMRRTGTSAFSAAKQQPDPIGELFRQPVSFSLENMNAARHLHESVNQGYEVLGSLVLAKCLPGLTPRPE